MTLNDWRNDIYAMAIQQGYHGEYQDDLCRKLMLVNCELCEAVEAERKGRKPKDTAIKTSRYKASVKEFDKKYKGAIEEEIADAIIRLFDIAGMIDMDLDWWISAKMNYNLSMSREGKKKRYG